MSVHPDHSSPIPLGISTARANHAAGVILDPRSLGLLLHRHRHLIGAVVAISLLGGATITTLMPRRYTATAVLLVDPRQQRIVQSEAVLAGIGNDTAAVESQIEVIQSTTLARRVIEEHHFEFIQDSEPSALGRFISSLGSLLPSQHTDYSAAATERLLLRFGRGLSVKRRGQTYAIEVSFTSSTPDLARKITDAVVNFYLDQQITLKRDAARNASDWLSDRLLNLRRQVDFADRAVAEYKAAHNLIDTGEQGGQRQTLMDQQLADLNIQLLQSRVKETDVQARYDQMKSARIYSDDNENLPETLQSPVILALRTQIAGMAHNVAEMARVYGPRHPTMQIGQAEIDELRRQMASEVGHIIAGLHKELEAAKARNRALANDLEALKTKAAKMDQDTVKLRELQREAVAIRTVLQQSLVRYRETIEQQSLQLSDVHVLSPAALPIAPSSPNVPVMMSLFTVAGLCTGLCLAILIDRRSPVVRTAQEAENFLGLPVLGLVPAVAVPDTTSHRSAQQASIRLDRLALDQPLSHFGEAIRGLTVRLSGQLGTNAKVLLVASAVTGEGVSTVAGNIARVMARGGAATLLIEADSRRAGTIEAAPGLYEVLHDGISPLKLLSLEADSGLATLPAGRVVDPGSGSELLAGRSMERALDALRAKFDHIVIDVTPILSSIESRALLNQADAALLVIACDKTRRDNLEAALESVDINACKFLGIALNSVNINH